MCRAVDDRQAFDASSGVCAGVRCVRDAVREGRGAHEAELAELDEAVTRAAGVVRELEVRAAQDSSAAADAARALKALGDEARALRKAIADAEKLVHDVEASREQLARHRAAYEEEMRHPMADLTAEERAQLVRERDEARARANDLLTKLHETGGENASVKLLREGEKSRTVQ